VRWYEVSEQETGSRTTSLFISLLLSLSFFLSLSLSCYVSLSLWLSLALSRKLSLSLALSRDMSLFLTLALTLSLAVLPLFFSLSLALRLPLSRIVLKCGLARPRLSLTRKRGYDKQHVSPSRRSRKSTRPLEHATFLAFIHGEYLSTFYLDSRERVTTLCSRVDVRTFLCVFSATFPYQPFLRKARLNGSSLSMVKKLFNRLPVKQLASSYLVIMNSVLL
jgi:hypothetical protein